MWTGKFMAKCKKIYFFIMNVIFLAMLSFQIFYWAHIGKNNNSNNKTTTKIKSAKLEEYSVIRTS